MAHLDDILNSKTVQDVLRSLNLPAQSNTAFFVAELAVNKLAQRAYPDMGLDGFDLGVKECICRALSEDVGIIGKRTAWLALDRIDKALDNAIAIHFGDLGRTP